VAYESNESGRSEVYVRALSGSGKWPVSTQGGLGPVWARNGKELFYRDGGKMMVVAVGPGPGFNAGQPQLLFRGDFDRGWPGSPNYDVSPDGQRFVMVQTHERPPVPTQLDVIVDWFDELRRAR
jgi:hypothetical protein